MKIKRKILTITISLYLIISSFISTAKSQQEESQEIETQQVELPPVNETEQAIEKGRKKGFFSSLFRKREAKEETPSPEAELRAKHREELQELRQRQVDEKKELQEKEKIEKSKEKSLREKTLEVKQKNRLLARKEYIGRKKEIRLVKKSNRYVEVITNQDDPLYIAEAGVLNSKTNFLKIKDVEFKYKIKVQNQTPKIINSVLVLWERNIPFIDTLTILKETKISKPIVPYEERIIEYNDLDSKREGEIYKVKIAKVVFEDGSQWQNPRLEESRQ